MGSCAYPLLPRLLRFVTLCLCKRSSYVHTFSITPTILMTTGVFSLRIDEIYEIPNNRKWLLQSSSIYRHFIAKFHYIPSSRIEGSKILHFVSLKQAGIQYWMEDSRFVSPHL